jgi:hypothetical protein
MKSQSALIRKWEIARARIARENASGVVGTAKKQSVSESLTLPLQALEQCFRPNILCREDAQCDKDGQPARPGRSYHDDSNREQSEAQHNL